MPQLGYALAIFIMMKTSINSRGFVSINQKKRAMAFLGGMLQLYSVEIGQERPYLGDDSVKGCRY